MNRRPGKHNRMLSQVFVAILLTLGLEASVRAQDNVTIPKSRLEELERKEKELERLRQQGQPAPEQPAAKAPATVSSGEISPVAPTVAPATAPTPAAAPKRNVPAISSLPPVKEGETIEAQDLIAYYKQDPASAEQRFKNRKLTLRGIISGFEKPLVTRNYYILLDTGDRDTRLVCDFVTPSKYNSVHTLRHGAELVANDDQSQTQLAKKGQAVLIGGKCKKFADGTLKFQAEDFKTAAP